MYRLIGSLLILFLKMTSRFEIVGKERLPKSGAYVLAGQHSTWLDVTWYGYTVWPRPIYYMAKESLFRKPIAAWILTQLKSFPVNRDNPGPSSLKIPRKLLQEGKVFGIFPSGTREQQSSLKQGVATIARREGAPIYPVVYIGPNKFRMSSFIKRQRVVVVIGDPIITASSVSPDEKAERASLLTILDERFEELQRKGQEAFGRA